MITRTLLAAHEPFFYLTYTYFCVVEKDCAWNESGIFGLARSFSFLSHQHLLYRPKWENFVNDGLPSFQDKAVNP